jgi:hypothetical protein
VQGPRYAAWLGSGGGRFAALLDAAGIPVSEILAWNAYPWYVNHKPSPAELDAEVEAIPTYHTSNQAFIGTSEVRAHRMADLAIGANAMA